ncbi:adenylate kinase [Halanaerobium hydrogeniformans]|uniref:Adenylate kinase n=1 Tax=Halanaerobium hydrogeniformans TaxID=656519 RepID=E4RJ99_HALHG|nr:adenylate kinase [Halanaerobium hydrogeniformans]ADQ15319.1 adenylate kinase [Halanaerobium hydrogeniformans]
MDIVLLGLPGVGKGTQAKMLEKTLGIPHIATGDIFRKAIKKKTALGKKAESFIEAGELVPDEITIGIVKERLSEPDCEEGMILDGFPRTIKQAEALDNILAEQNRGLDISIFLQAEKEVLIKRLSGRRVCVDCGATYHIENMPPKKDNICDECGGNVVQRSDDEEETVKNRIEVNKEKTVKLADYYRNQGILEEVQSTGGIENVQNKLIKVIEAYR